MRLLFLAHSHPELQAGGTEIFALDLFRILRRRGHCGVFVAGTGAHQRPPSPGASFQGIGGKADELLIWSGGFDAFSLSQVDLHGFSRSFSELIKQQQPDVIHVHHLLNIGVEAIGQIKRAAPQAKIIMTLHDYYPICPNDGQLMTTGGSLCDGARPDDCRKCFPQRSATDIKLRELYIRQAFDLIDHFVAPSEFIRQKFVDWGLQVELISVIPNGLPSAEAAPFRNAKRRDHFAFFGHINAFKGAVVAVEASSILSKEGFPHLLSIHGGSEFQSQKVRSQFADACDRAPDTRYFGGYRRPEFKRLISNADWVVFPSIWWENAPLVISEALQHQRPVLCSNIGGPLELIQNGVNGLHFPVGDAAALAELMRHVVEERGLWMQLRSACDRPFSIDESAERHQVLYQQTCRDVSRRLAA